MTVELENKSTVLLRDVKVGDKVQVEHGKFEPIYGFGHSDQTLSGHYLQLRLSNGRQLEISGDHMVFVQESNSVPASMVRVGDELVSSDDGEVKIESIQQVTSKGAFAPFTYSGTIIINGIKASTYISLQPGTEFLIIGEFQTPFSHQWLAHSFLLPFRLLGSDTILSVWMDWLQETSQWLLTQHPIVVSAVMVPLVAVFGTATAGEALWLHPGWALAVGLVAYFAFHIQQTSTKAKIA